MASILKVDKLDPQSGTALEIGSPGDTITIPSGATFTQSGTMNASAITAGTIDTARLGSGTASSSTVLYGDQTYKAEPTGTALSGSTNNTVTTVTGADAIQGEANLTFDGSTLDVTGAATVTGVVTGKKGYFNQTGTGAGTEALKLRKTAQFSEPAINLVQYTHATDTAEVQTMLIHGHRYYGSDDNTTLCINNFAAGGIQFDIGGVANGAQNTAMEIAGSTKNVLIGTTADEARVCMVTGAATPVLYLEQSSTSGYGSFVFKLNSGQSTTDGSFNLIEAANGAGTKFRVADSGNVTNTNNSYGSLSDERIKQDITDANSQWDDIKALKVRNFKLKQEPTKSQLGVIAQELETAGMNGLVVEAKPNKEDVAYHSDFGTVVEGTAENGATPIKDEDENITGYEDIFTAGQRVKEVKYSVLYMKAIKALQESMERIEQLESKVTALEAK